MRSPAISRAGCWKGCAHWASRGSRRLPGALERPLSDGRPLLGPVDFRYAAIGVRPSPVSSAALHRLGATARPLRPGGDIDPLDAAEQSVAEVVADPRPSSSTRRGPDITMNVVLWPRVTVVVMNPRAAAALSPVQLQALRRAGTAAAAPAVHRLVRAEQDGRSRRCAGRPTETANCWS